jgi:hypothetical protein
VGGGSNDLRLFLNGNLLASGTGAAANNLTDVNIAREYSGRYLNARVDEVRISSVARSTNWLWAGVQNLAANDAFSRIGSVVVSSNQPLTLALAAFTNGVCSLWISGLEPWRDCLVQVSTNLADPSAWSTVLQTNTGAGSLCWASQAGGEPRRFPRALQNR